MVSFADINVSHNSVATYARLAGIFNIHLTTNLPNNRPVKKKFKSVKIWQNYGHESVARLFWPTLYSSPLLNNSNPLTASIQWTCVNQNPQKPIFTSHMLLLTATSALELERRRQRSLQWYSLHRYTVSIPKSLPIHTTVPHRQSTKIF